MQMWTESRGRWRKKGRRGVSPIIATILLVAITVVLAAVLYILISGLTKGPGNTPIGSALAMGTATPGTNGTLFTYTISITPSSGLTVGSVDFSIQSSAGVIQAQPATSNIQVIGPQGCLVATYTFSTNAWASGSAGASTHACSPVGTSSTILTSGMQFYLQTAASLSGQGNVLQAIGVGSFSGTENCALP
jgi:flagellin-like protein